MTGSSCADAERQGRSPSCARSRRNGRAAIASSPDRRAAVVARRDSSLVSTLGLGRPDQVRRKGRRPPPSAVSSEKRTQSPAKSSPKPRPHPSKPRPISYRKPQRSLSSSPQPTSPVPQSQSNRPSPKSPSRTTASSSNKVLSLSSKPQSSELLITHSPRLPGASEPPSLFTLSPSLCT